MDTLVTQAGDFVTGELLPTLAALVAAAAREPLTWAVLATGAAGHAAWQRWNHLD
jgi:hypothetical protein